MNSKQNELKLFVFGGLFHLTFAYLLKMAIFTREIFHRVVCQHI